MERPKLLANEANTSHRVPRTGTAWFGEQRGRAGASGLCTFPAACPEHTAQGTASGSWWQSQFNWNYPANYISAPSLKRFFSTRCSTKTTKSIFFFSQRITDFENPDCWVSILSSFLLIPFPLISPHALVQIPSSLPHNFYWADQHRIYKITNCCYPNFTRQEGSTDKLIWLAAITSIYGTARGGTPQVRGSA